MVTVHLLRALTLLSLSMSFRRHCLSVSVLHDLILLYARNTHYHTQYVIRDISARKSHIWTAICVGRGWQTTAHVPTACFCTGSKRGGRCTLLNVLCEKEELPLARTSHLTLPLGQHSLRQRPPGPLQESAHPRRKSTVVGCRPTAGGSVRCRLHHTFLFPQPAVPPSVTPHSLQLPHVADAREVPVESTRRPQNEAQHTVRWTQPTPGTRTPGARPPRP